MSKPYYILEVHTGTSGSYTPIPVPDLLLTLKNIPKSIIKVSSPYDPSLHPHIGVLGLQLATMGFCPHLVSYVPDLTEPSARVLTTFFKRIEITSPPKAISSAQLQTTVELLRRCTPNTQQIVIRDTPINRQLFGTLSKHWNIPIEPHTMPPNAMEQDVACCVSTCEGVLVGNTSFPCTPFRNLNVTDTSRKQTRELIASGNPHLICKSCPRLHTPL